MLIGPMWSLNKWEVLNSIEMEMRRRGSVQGCKAVKQEFENERPLEWHMIFWRGCESG